MAYCGSAFLYKADGFIDLNMKVFIDVWMKN